MRASTAFAGLVVIFIGLPASQLTEFTQQYAQRIGGAVDQLRIVINEFDADAARSDLDRPSALLNMRENPEQFIRDQGVRMSERITRLERLEYQQRVFARGGLFAQIDFLWSHDSELAQRTWDNYKMAFNIEGIILGAFSAAIVFLLTILLTSQFSSHRKDYA
jgi:preprotein translocase subunit YajC